ncbi:MAG: hypothetical protein KKF44_00125 [Nanoarchaeota archaeon]|nr:hypothetical protein [Nanoarchaeota archaeon]
MNNGNNKFKFYFIIFLVASIFVLASCSRCPKSCNDFNDCTRDFCDKDTGYACAHHKIDGCTCGDKECEKDIGENECTCAKDCGKCTGNVNDYVEKGCVDDICISKLKDSVELLTQTAVREVKTSYFNIDLKITYDDPLNVESSEVTSEFRLEDINPAIKDLKLTGITIYDDKQILMNEILFSEKMDSIKDSFKKTVVLKGYQVVDVKKKKTLFMDIAYEYEQKYGDTYKTIRSSQKQKFGPVLLVSAGTI